MKAKAEEYSFNIESQLFPTLNAEQQKLWKAEIEQAYKAGSGAITQDQISRENLNDAASRALKETPIPELPAYAFKKGFEKGAEWADKNSISQNQIDALRMEYEKGRADAIAHPTGGELLHVLNKGHKQGYKEATDKLYEWLRTNHDEIFLRYVRGYNADDEIELLKKYMEGQQ